jgi:hypothetical protein
VLASDQFQLRAFLSVVVGALFNPKSLFRIFVILGAKFVLGNRECVATCTVFLLNNTMLRFYISGQSLYFSF